MNSVDLNFRSAAQADAREHGVSLRLERADVSPMEETTRERQASESALEAVHHALSGVALAQVDASELLVRVSPEHDHQVEVDTSLRA